VRERVRSVLTVEQRTQATRTTHVESILSPTHLLLILVVALIVLGPKGLPEAGRGLGSAIRGFKDSLSTAERREEQPAIQPSREPDHTPGA
jgi:sec-independent protein translocase protein TatA